MKPKLLFIYLHPSPFVLDDLAFLNTSYEVRPFHFDACRARSASGMLRLLWAQWRWLQRELAQAQLVLGWFVDYHMALPVTLARRWHIPVAVILGGFDCRCLPPKEGVFCSSWRAAVARYVYRRASLLLPVSARLIEMPATAWTGGLAQGVRAWVPRLHTPFAVIPTGYDPAFWPMGPEQRSPVVRTVAFVDSERVVYCKGIDLLFQVARQLPEVSFEVIGVAPAVQSLVQRHYAPPPNVVLRPPVPRTALPAIYAETSVYVQLSRAEGLPNALCEAMLCGCIPVGSSVFGIPEVIGDAGIVVDKPDPEVIARAIQQALSLGTEWRHRARKRIVTHFSRERREAALLEALATLGKRV
jgi:glycosyltransferase involved in cell wall biosynthesis